MRRRLPNGWWYEALYLYQGKKQKIHSPKFSKNFPLALLVK
jgi:hypothetical protein